MAGRTHLWVQAGEWIIDRSRSPWTHAGCVLDGGRILEAMPGGARIGSLDELAGRPHAFSTWDLPDAKRVELVAAAAQFVGVPYSGADYAAITLHDLAPSYDAEWLRDFIDTSNHLLCSQLVDKWLTSCGLHPFSDGRWPGYVKPSDLGRILSGPQLPIDRSAP
jgi:hypothetical protein